MRASPSLSSVHDHADAAHLTADSVSQSVAPSAGEAAMPAADGQPASRFIQLSTGSLHYLEAGAGAPLLLLHANPGDARDYAAVMPELARHHRVMAIDWPGYGLSAQPEEPERWHALRFHDVLREFLARMGLDRALLVGNSLGGNAAARLAAEAPGLVAGLVLVAPGGFTPHNVVTRAFCRLQGSRMALPPRWWAGMCLRRRNAFTRAMLARAQAEQSRPQSLMLNRAVWRSFAAPEHDLRERARRIECPVLCIFGAGDPAISARTDRREAQGAMPHARCVSLPCGHAAFAEMPERFLQEVQPFLANCGA